MPGKRIGFCGFVGAAVLLGAAFGQNAAVGDPLDGVPESAVRFTPGMARAIARTVTRETIVRGYGLDEAKSQQAIDAVARRLMILAHRLDTEASQGAVEQMFEAMLEVALEEQAGRRVRGMPPAFARAAGEGLVPMMPAIRDFVRDVGQDIRPMLAPKQQLKLAADWVKIGLAMEGFEKMMERWSAGEVNANDNPFRPNVDPMNRDESGQSQVLRNARRSAERAVKMHDWVQWKNYVKKAKAFYQLDKAQSTTADSILAECIARGSRVVEDESWERRMYGNRLWRTLSFEMQLGWENPLRHCVEREYEALMGPLDALGEELKERIELLATESQRKAADARLLAALIEQGYEPDE